MIMNVWETHVDTLTMYMKKWMETGDNKLVLDGWLRYIQLEHATWQAGNEVYDEDVEYLAEKISSYAKDKLDPRDDTIQVKFIQDCLSEVDYMGLAEQYVALLAEEKWVFS